MKTKLTGNELLHFLFLKALSCRVSPCGNLFQISDELDNKWLRLDYIEFWWWGWVGWPWRGWLASSAIFHRIGLKLGMMTH